MEDLGDKQISGLDGLPLCLGTETQWCKPRVSVLSRLRKEDREFKARRGDLYSKFQASPNYIARPTLK